MNVSGESRTLGGELIALALSLDVRIAVAESLTGGLLADALVSVPGASRVFSGGVVAYDTALKHSLLGVNATLLRDRGPVDESVAIQMAAGVRRACRIPERGIAELGISTTGVAGPDPDPQTGQLAGTVWIGLSAFRRTRAGLHELQGDRETIRRAAVAAALQAAIEELTLVAGESFL